MKRARQSDLDFQHLPFLQETETTLQQLIEDEESELQISGEDARYEPARQTEQTAELLNVDQGISANQPNQTNDLLNEDQGASDLTK